MNQKQTKKILVKKKDCAQIDIGAIHSMNAIHVSFSDCDFIDTTSCLKADENTDLGSTLDEDDESSDDPNLQVRIFPQN